MKQPKSFQAPVEDRHCNPQPEPGYRQTNVQPWERRPDVQHRIVFFPSISYNPTLWSPLGLGSNLVHFAPVVAYPFEQYIVYFFRNIHILLWDCKKKTCEEWMHNNLYPTSVVFVREKLSLWYNSSNNCHPPKKYSFPQYLILGYVQLN